MPGGEVPSRNRVRGLERAVRADGVRVHDALPAARSPGFGAVRGIDDAVEDRPAAVTVVDLEAAPEAAREVEGLDRLVLDRLSARGNEGVAAVRGERHRPRPAQARPFGHRDQPASGGQRPAGGGYRGASRRSGRGRSRERREQRGNSPCATECEPHPFSRRKLPRSPCEAQARRSQGRFSKSRGLDRLSQFRPGVERAVGGPRRGRAPGVAPQTRALSSAHGRCQGLSRRMPGVLRHDHLGRVLAAPARGLAARPQAPPERAGLAEHPARLVPGRRACRTGACSAPTWPGSESTRSPRRAEATS